MVARAKRMNNERKVPRALNRKRCLKVNVRTAITHHYIGNRGGFRSWIERENLGKEKKAGGTRQAGKSQTAGGSKTVKFSFSEFSSSCNSQNGDCAFDGK